MNDKHMDIREAVLRKISTNKMHMHPRYYFVLKIVALAVVSLAVLLVSIFIFNFIVFSIRINGQDTLLGFGPRGIGAFLRFFPWSLLVLDAALVIALQWMLRYFRLGYKTPVLYLLGGLVLATVVVGFAVDRATPFNDDLLHRADEHALPAPFGDFYGRARHHMEPGSGVCKCTITGIQGNVITAEDRDMATTTKLTIILPLNDPHATTSQLHVGDVIFAAGDTDDGVMHAFGVHAVPADRMGREVLLK